MFNRLVFIYAFIVHNYVLIAVFMFAAKVANNIEISKGSLVSLSCKLYGYLQRSIFDITWITIVTNNFNYTIITGEWHQIDSKWWIIPNSQQY